jgi:hypothetical protein
MQAALYVAALMRKIPVIGRLKPIYLAYYFCIVNVAALLGTAGVLVGQRFVMWRPERPQSDKPVAARGR